MIPFPPSKTKAPSLPSQSVARTIASSILYNDGITLPNQIHNLASKAPEVIRLLDDFLGKLPSLVKDSVEIDKRQRARKLRAISDYKEVFVRRSMTIDERKKERNLRNQARELNDKEFIDISRSRIRLQLS
ncbi:hypothetical protein OSTOST_20918 [Ostertagia ostertagi]